MVFDSGNDFFFINGTINCNEYLSGFEYDHKFVFMNPNKSNIHRSILEVPSGKEEWEVGLTSVNYLLPDENLFLFLHPNVAKIDNTYHLYDGEIMIGAVPFFPINYLNPLYDTTAGVTKFDLKSEFLEFYGITETTGNYITNNFQKNLDMWTDFESQMKNKTLVNGRRKFYDWYKESIDSPVETVPGAMRSPFLRFNFLDRILEEFPLKFSENNNHFAVLNFQQICSISFISPTSLATAEAYATNNKINGFIKTPLIFNKDCWSSVLKSLPSITVDNTLQQNNPNQNYCVNLKTPLSTGYVAFGSKLKKLFGMTKIAKTEPIYVDNTSNVIIRPALDIVYSSIHSSFTTPCSVTKKQGTTEEIIFPKCFTDGEAHSSTITRGLWRIPNLQTYQTDGSEYETFIQAANNSIFNNYSDGPINITSSGEIYLYTNIVNEIYHIGNHLSPFLAAIPAPSFNFGDKTISPLQTGLGPKTESLIIKHPVFVTLRQGANLDNTMFFIKNNYGDKVNAGFLHLTLQIRRKKKL